MVGLALKLEPLLWTVFMVQTRAISDAELMRFSSMNPELRFERDADGSLVSAPPKGWISGNREAKAISRLMVWVEDNDLGEVFNSSSRSPFAGP